MELTPNASIAAPAIGGPTRPPTPHMAENAAGTGNEVSTLERVAHDGQSHDINRECRCGHNDNGWPDEPGIDDKDQCNTGHNCDEGRTYNDADA